MRNIKGPVILILEEEGRSLEDLKKHLRQDGSEVIVSFRNLEFLSLFQKDRPNLAIISSNRNSTWDALEVAGAVRQQDRTTPVILVVHVSSEAQAIAALRLGVTDYFKRPVSLAELQASIRRHLPGYPRKALAAQSASGKPWLWLGFIGETPRIRQVKQYVTRAAAIDCNVLITGETGTGKERIAELLHSLSSRRTKTMVCVNCAALPENLFESELFGYEQGAFTGAVRSSPGKLRMAEGGTVFLDEVSEMSPYMQAKILRAIDNQSIYSLGGRKEIPLDIRVVAATNQELDHSMKQGTFRKDLYFRLNVARVHLPPLRERREDIPLLLEHYLGEMNRRFGRQVEGFSGEVMDLLLAYSWPGNIRELKNLVEALFINLPAREVSLVHLPESFRKLKENLEAPLGEREQVLNALLATNWNKSKAAEKLSWCRMTLYRKMRKYEIKEVR
ncbi:MAG: sigma-54 dependent transcriptional regulator [Desulfobaccales bacterium]